MSAMQVIKTFKKQLGGKSALGGDVAATFVQVSTEPSRPQIP